MCGWACLLDCIEGGMYRDSRSWVWLLPPQHEYPVAITPPTQGSRHRWSEKEEARKVSLTGHSLIDGSRLFVFQTKDAGCVSNCDTGLLCWGCLGKSKMCLKENTR